MDFNQPGSGSGDKINMKELLGRLILVYPKKIEVGVKTQGFGDKDPLVADVVVLDGPTAGEELSDVFIFQGVLIGQLKHFIGDANPALGRVILGEAKLGQNPPYQLAEFTQNDAAIANAWVTAHPRGFRQAAPAQSPPAQQNGYVDRATGEIHPAAVQTQTPPPAAAPPRNLDVGTVRTLIGLNIADDQITASTGATAEQIAAIRNLPVG